MTSFTVYNSDGEVQVNGKELPVACSGGFETPATITGSGNFYISCNPNQPTEIGEREVSVLLDKANPDEMITLKEKIYKPAPETSITLSDELGFIATVEQNTRYPEEWDFPLTRQLTVT